MAADQIAAARVFYWMMDKFFNIIVRLPLDHLTERRMNVNLLLQQNVDKYIEAFGFARATLSLLKIKRVVLFTCMDIFLGLGISRSSTIGFTRMTSENV